MDLFADDVALWEVGNEVNGEWLGPPSTVVEKLLGAQQIVADAGRSSAVTLYYNPNCWERLHLHRDPRRCGLRRVSQR